MMQVEEKYKQTELGLIPIDWDVKRISEISNPVRGGSPRPAGDPKYFNGNFIPWLTVAALTNIPLSQIYVSETENCLTEEGSLHSRILEKETLIIANSGATLGVAKLLVIRCCANDGIAALLDFDKESSKEYLVYFINTQIKYLREVVATGNGQPNLNTALIGNIKVPLPPTKEEQTAIASALSDADVLVRSLEKLIAKKRNIKQGAMQKLLQPKESWEVKKLGEIFKFYTTANYSKAEMSFNGEIGCLHYGLIHAIPNSIYSLENGVKYFVKEDATSYELIKDGDIVMVDASEDFLGINKSIEVSGVANRKFIAGLHTYLMRDESLVLVNRFRGLVLNSNMIKQQLVKLAVGMKVYGVSKSQLKEVLIPIPSKEEQTYITTILSDMDAEITALETKLEKFKKVKLGMLQNLLTGKIRLV